MRLEDIYHEIDPELDFEYEYFNGFTKTYLSMKKEKIDIVNSFINDMDLKELNDLISFIKNNQK